jgi:uncharacterized protein (DUF952 family)
LQIDDENVVDPAFPSAAEPRESRGIAARDDPSVIHHAVSGAVWEQAKAAGRYAPPSLATEGFIHCSTAAQLDAVIAAFYADVADLVVLDLDDARLPVRWEPPAHPDGRPAGAEEPRFPHVYGPIEPRDVVRVWRYPPQRL